MEATWYKANGRIYMSGETAQVTAEELQVLIASARCKAQVTEDNSGIYVTLADADRMKVMKALLAENISYREGIEFKGFRIFGKQLDITPEQMAYNLEDMKKVGA